MRDRQAAKAIDRLIKRMLQTLSSSLRLTGREAEREREGMGREAERGGNRRQETTNVCVCVFVCACVCVTRIGDGGGQYLTDKALFQPALLYWSASRASRLGFAQVTPLSPSLHTPPPPSFPLSLPPSLPPSLSLSLFLSSRAVSRSHALLH